ncbi:MAG: membrane protein insertion efficiency factor YidD [Bacteroidales bacterium]
MKSAIYSFLLIIYIYSYSDGYSQTTNKIFNSEDLQLIAQQSYSNPLFVERQVKYGFEEVNKSFNPFYYLLSSSMFVYQKYISPIILRHCIYIPSCSGYSKVLIKNFGLLKGMFCSADRLMRCNRIALSDNNAKYLLIKGNGHISESPLRYKIK